MERPQAHPERLDHGDDAHRAAGLGLLQAVLGREGAVDGNLGHVMARDLHAASEADRFSRAIARMESREGARARSYAERVSVGGDRDVMEPTDRRIDYEERCRRRDEDYALIDCACEVIYGRDQCSGGIDAILGSAYADALWWRYCAAATWPEVAGGVGMSERFCRVAVRVALDTIDAYGLDRVATGLGLAEG